MAKFLNLLLLLLLIGGVVRIFMQTSALKSLTDEHRRLASMHGELDVRDEEKFLVAGVDTGDPMRFQWRVYYPAGLSVESRIGFGVEESGGSSTVTNDIEVPHRCNFEFKQNELRAHCFQCGGGTLARLSKRGEVAFLKEHWSRLEVTQLGDKGPVEINTDRVMELLMIRIPEELMPEFERLVDRSPTSRYPAGCFFKIVSGTPAAFTSFDKQNLESDSE